MLFTTTEGIQGYLDARSIEYKTVTPLEGGTANFVWLVEPESGPPFVIKHAEPYVKVNHNIPFPVDRMSFEAQALGTLPSRLPNNQLIQLPRILRYDEESQILAMTGGASRTLKDAYTTDLSLDVSTWGHRLGEWLAGLHGSVPKTAIGDNEAAKRIYRHCYNRLGSALDAYAMDGELGTRINDKYGSLLETDDECICHGDFWPGNILFGQHGSDVATVIDWEMVRRGCGATDVGQFAAEAYLLDRFRGSRGLLPAFLTGYRKTAIKLDESFAIRVGVHFGTHLGFWTTVVPWASGEETREVVRLGAEMLENIEERGHEYLKESILKVLVT